MPFGTTYLQRLDESSLRPHSVVSKSGLKKIVRDVSRGSSDSNLGLAVN